MDNIFDEAAKHAAQVNSLEQKQLQCKQALWNIATEYADDVQSGAVYYADAPDLIKNKVKEILIRRHREDLIIE